MQPKIKYILLKIFLLSTLCLTNLGVFGQNFNDQSNYMAFKPLINTGANSEFENLAVILIGRQQWAGIEGAPASLGLQMVKPFYNYTVGGAVFQETIGVHSLQRFTVNYSYSISLASSNKLSFGLGAGGVVLTSNYNLVNPNDWNDDQFAGIKTIIRPDFNFGIFLSSKQYFAGLSVPRLIESSIINNDGNLEGNTNYDPLLWTYLLTGGYHFKLNSELTLTSATLVKINLNAPVDADLNLSLNADKYSFGLSYRTKREFLVFGDLALTKSIRFGYSFHNYFNIQSYYLTGHEIYIIYQFVPKKEFRNQSPRF